MLQKQQRKVHVPVVKQPKKILFDASPDLKQTKKANHRLRIKTKKVRTTSNPYRNLPVRKGNSKLRSGIYMHLQNYDSPSSGPSSMYLRRRFKNKNMDIVSDLPPIEPAPTYNHGKNNDLILEALRKTKFHFHDQKVHFDMMKEYNHLLDQEQPMPYQNAS